MLTIAAGWGSNSHACTTLAFLSEKPARNQPCVCCVPLLCLLIAVLEVLGITVILVFFKAACSSNMGAGSSWCMLQERAVQLCKQHSSRQDSTVRSHFTQLPASCKRYATLAEVEQLAAMQQCPAYVKGKTPLLVTCEGVAKALHKCQGLPAAVALLRQPQFSIPSTSAAAGPLHQPQVAQQVQQVAAMAALTAVPAPAVAGVTGQDHTSATCLTNLPDTLVEGRYTQQQLQQAHYGFHKQAGGVPPQVLTGLAGLQHWACQPIMLSRPWHMKCLASNTWSGVRNELARFLGFCSMMEGVEQPCLHHCLNGQLVIYFLSFLQERGVAPNQMRDMVSNIKRACTYLHATNQLSPSVQLQLPAYLTWLHNLQHQVGNLQPLASGTQQHQQQQDMWLEEPVKILHCITSLHLAGVSLVWQVQQGGIHPSLGVTMHIMQAAMCCLLFGFVPCMRPSMVVSLQVPGYAGPCTWEDCQHKTLCPGNRLEWAVNSSSSNSSSSGSWEGAQLHVVIVHHKNSYKGKDRTISYALPADINPLLVFMVTVGQQVLQGQGLVFCMPGGAPMTEGRLRLWWKHAIKPAGISLPPQQARGAFVTLLKEAEKEDIVLKGDNLDSNAAAAFAMGTSIRMWRTVYDKLAELRAVQAVVCAMAWWRENVLQLGYTGKALQDALACKQAATAAGVAHVPAAAVAAAPAQWDESGSEGEWEEEEEEDSTSEEEEWEEGMADDHPTTEEEQEYY